MPGNPNQFSIKLPNVPAKNDQEAAENWRQIDQWDRRLAPTGRTQIASTVTNAITASVTWPNLPQNYNNLYLVASVGCTGAAGNNNLLIQFNGDAGLNYNWTVVGSFGGAAPGTNSAGGQSSAIVGNIPGNTARTGHVTLVMPNYSRACFKGGPTQTSSYETTTSSIQFGGIWWNNTVPITQIKLFPNTGSFVAGSAFWLYGEF